MKNYIYMLVIAVALSSCGSSKKLYSWNKYEQASYSYLKKADEKSTNKIIKEYKKIINEQKGIRKSIPPGMCADYGFLLIQKGNKADGIANLKKEIALYPESKVFIDRILKLIE
tara:strand:+ start:181 stop:522 length:342 start_codon:yes stop_codon:yes gene_type:complete